MRTPAYLSREERYAGVIFFAAVRAICFQPCDGRGQAGGGRAVFGLCFFYSVLLPVDSRRIRSVCT